MYSCVNWWLKNSNQWENGPAYSSKFSMTDLKIFSLVEYFGARLLPISYQKIICSLGKMFACKKRSSLLYFWERLVLYLTYKFYVGNEKMFGWINRSSLFLNIANLSLVWYFYGKRLMHYFTSYRKRCFYKTKIAYFYKMSFEQYFNWISF